MTQNHPIRLPIARRGNALLFTVVIAVIFAVMGGTFVVVSRLDRQSVSRIARQSDADQSLDLVLAKISEVLTADVIGKPEAPGMDSDLDNVDGETQLNLLAEPTRAQTRVGTAAAIDLERPNYNNFNVLNEPWDMPSHGHGVNRNTLTQSVYDQNVFTHNAGPDRFLGTSDDVWYADDKWLADIEPDITDPALPIWRHITDIDGQIAEMRFQNSTLFPNDKYNPGVTVGGVVEDRVGDPVDFQNLTPRLVTNKDIDDPNNTSIFFGAVPNRSAAPYKINRVGDPADADGDGVTDARWIRWRTGFTPIDTNGERRPVYYQTPDGNDVYVALRIIDNSAMVNLNTAYGDAPQGGMLTDVGAVDLGRGVENPDHVSGPLNSRNLHELRTGEGSGAPPMTSAEYNDYLLKLKDITDKTMSGASPNPNWQPIQMFDLGDELEMRHRFFIDSPQVARFETPDPANTTDALGSGWARTFTNTNNSARVVRTSRFSYEAVDVLDLGTLSQPGWAAYFDPSSMDPNINTSYPDDDFFDRRHMCTFASWSRTLRRRSARLGPMRQGPGANSVTSSALDPDLGRDFLQHRSFTTQLMPEFPNPLDLGNFNPESPQQVLQLLYTMRSYFMDMGYVRRDAAIRAAQFTANLIDRLDADYNAGTPPFTARTDLSNSASADYAPNPLFDPLNGYMGDLQLRDDPTVINQAVIDTLIDSYVGPGSSGRLRATRLDFGLNDPVVPCTPGGRPGGVPFPPDPNDITHVVGYERQPFITKVWVRMQDKDSGLGEPDAVRDSAIELYNPYPDPINLDGWRIVYGSDAGPAWTYTFTTAQFIPASTGAPGTGRLILALNSPQGRVNQFINDTGADVTLIQDPVVRFSRQSDRPVKLQRPVLPLHSIVNPGSDPVYITVDEVPGETSGGVPGMEDLTADRTSSSTPIPESNSLFYDRVIRRREDPGGSNAATKWAFARGDALLTEGVHIPNGTITINQSEFSNGIIFIPQNTGGSGIGEIEGSPTNGGGVDTLAELLGLLQLGSTAQGDLMQARTLLQEPLPAAIESIAGSNERKARVDILPFQVGPGLNNNCFEPNYNVPASEIDPEYVSILDYVTFLGKPQTIMRNAFYADLRLHGRINVNTAPGEVLMRVFEPFEDKFLRPTDPTPVTPGDAARQIVYGTTASKPPILAGDPDYVPGLVQLRNDVMWNGLPDFNAEGIVPSPQRRNHTGFASVHQLLDRVRYEPPTIDPIAGIDPGTGTLAERYRGLSNVYNQLTTRTDVVTAYILIRVQDPGRRVNDPSDDTMLSERRYLAIFDRSGVFKSVSDTTHDGIDNDGDGEIDEFGETEDPNRNYQTDGIDNDGDGRIDENGERPSIDNNGIDDDRDGLIDNEPFEPSPRSTGIRILAVREID